MSDRKVWPWVLVAVLGGGFLLVVGCCGFIGWRFFSASNEVSGTVDEFLRRIGNGRAEAAYDELTTFRFRRAEGRAEFAKRSAMIRERLGRYLEKGTRQFYLNYRNGTWHARASYGATFEKGTATVTVRLTKQSGRWLIDGCDIDAPALQPPENDSKPPSKEGKPRRKKTPPAPLPAPRPDQ